MRHRIAASVLTALLTVSGYFCTYQMIQSDYTLETSAVSIEEIPDEFIYASDWIWENRIIKEKLTEQYNTIFDQIISGNGVINYIVKWQSYKSITYDQRRGFEKLLSDCINDWNKWLTGYENWPYEHIEVHIIGWAVINKDCLLDLHSDETVYTETRSYNSLFDVSNGYEKIPDKEPYAPESRFDMYMWATEGFTDVGGCGGEWGQRLSDNAYLKMLECSDVHILEHEIGHGFGMPDFYGGEGETDGYPPGGFPGGESSIMMAGAADRITNFDGWMLRYIWTKIKDDKGRFALGNTSEQEAVKTADTPYNGDPLMSAASSGRIADFNGWILRYIRTKLKEDDEIPGLFTGAIINEDHCDKVRGDVNNDGVFNVADIVVYSKQLHSSSYQQFEDEVAELIIKGYLLNLHEY